MRADFGLPPPELRIGLSAHDFVQCCGAAEVYLTRGAAHRGDADDPVALAPAPRCAAGGGARRPGGAPHHGAGSPRLVVGPRPARGGARPLASAGAQAPRRGTAQTALGHPDRDLDRRPLFHLCAGHSPPPAPRPRRRGPERGGARHRHPPDSGGLRARSSRCAACGCRREAACARPGSSSRQRARGPACSPSGGRASSASVRWFLETERARRPAFQPLATEVEGALDLDAPGGSFRLTAKADRIDRTEAGALEINRLQDRRRSEKKPGRRRQVPAALAGGGDCGCGRLRRRGRGRSRGARVLEVERRRDRRRDHRDRRRCG